MRGEDQKIFEVRVTASPQPPCSPHMTLLINRTRLYWICTVLTASLCSVPEAKTKGGCRWARLARYPKLARRRVEYGI